MPLHTFIEKTKSYCLIHVFQGRIQGEGAGSAHPPWDDLRLSNKTGILQKKNTMWFIGVEVEQETSAPPPKKILDPPLQRTQVKFYRFNSDRWIRLISINRFLSIYRMIFRYQFYRTTTLGNILKELAWRPWIGFCWKLIYCVHWIQTAFNVLSNILHDHRLMFDPVRVFEPFCEWQITLKVIA